MLQDKTKLMRPMLLALLALACASCEPAAPSSTVAAKARKESTGVNPAGVRGEVVGVTDGDTITALIDGKTVKVRLHGIDSPEGGQAFGAASKRALSALVFGRRVKVFQTDTDRWGRMVAEVYADGVRVSAAMVRDGKAWHFVRYAPNDETLAAGEASARAARRGLWADPAPVAPWDWRKGIR